MILHPTTCRCCAALLTLGPVAPGSMSRRGFLATAGAAAALLPGITRAASGKYAAMLLTCIDPRFPEHTISYMRGRNLAGQYSQISLAGAGIAVVAPAFDKWRAAFWENLAASIQLHSIGSIIALDHRECGAAEIAYGKEAVSTPAKETATHQQALADFRSQVHARHPTLKVETGLMALDGKVQIFTG